MLKVPFTKEMIDMQYMLPRLTNRERSLCGTDIQSLESICDAAAQTKAELSYLFLIDRKSKLWIPQFHTGFYPRTVNEISDQQAKLKPPQDMWYLNRTSQLIFILCICSKKRLQVTAPVNGQEVRHLDMENQYNMQVKDPGRSLTIDSLSISIV